MVVILKDGTKFKIPAELALEISRRLDKHDWMTINDEEDDSVIFIIQMKEIAAITEEETIIP